LAVGALVGSGRPPVRLTTGSPHIRASHAPQTEPNVQSSFTFRRGLHNGNVRQRDLIAFSLNPNLIVPRFQSFKREATIYAAENSSEFRSIPQDRHLRIWNPFVDLVVHDAAEVTYWLDRKFYAGRCIRPDSQYCQK
jgi:hypothetical protein